MADMVSKGRQARGVRSGVSKLSEEDVLAIRLAKSSGERTSAIAERYALTASHVNSIARGDSWKHVSDRGSVGRAIVMSDEEEPKVLTLQVAEVCLGVSA